MSMNSSMECGYDVAIESLADALALPECLFDQAERCYKCLGGFLQRNESTVHRYNPDVYIQGSFALGTPIKPDSGDEDYDLDIVVTFRSLTKKDISQADLRSLLRKELCEFRKAVKIQKKVKEFRRCFSLLYSPRAQFHMDILPAVPNGDNDEIAITDRDETGKYDIITEDWRRSNPKAFALWFDAEQKKSTASVESIQDIPVFRDPTPLQSAIMILKRHRDQWFRDKPNLKVISIILTTLSTHAYTHEPRILEKLHDEFIGTTHDYPRKTPVSDAIKKILKYMDRKILKRGGVYWIENPTDRSENFADRWETHPERREAFFSWLEAARKDFQKDQWQNENDPNIVLDGLALALGNPVVEEARSKVSTNLW